MNSKGNFLVESIGLAAPHTVLHGLAVCENEVGFRMAEEPMQWRKPLPALLRKTAWAPVDLTFESGQGFVWCCHQVVLAWIKDSHLGMWHMGSGVDKVHPTGGLLFKFIHSSKHQTPHCLALPGSSITRNANVKGCMWVPVGLCVLSDQYLCRMGRYWDNSSHRTVVPFCSFQCKSCGKFYLVGTQIRQIWFPWCTAW